jgi:hypothetical protein
MANPKVTARIEGVDSLKRTIARYSSAALRNGRRELQRQAFEIQTLARRYAPVETGNLVASIQTDFTRLDRLYARVATALEYAKRQHYGFKGTDSLGRTYDQSGFFYFTKAVKQRKQAFKRDMARAIGGTRI